jgi:hypothetical protein
MADWWRSWWRWLVWWLTSLQRAHAPRVDQLFFEISRSLTQLAPYLGRIARPPCPRRSPGPSGARALRLDRMRRFKSGAILPQTNLRAADASTYQIRGQGRGRGAAAQTVASTSCLCLELTLGVEKFRGLQAAAVRERRKALEEWSLCLAPVAPNRATEAYVIWRERQLEPNLGPKGLDSVISSFRRLLYSFWQVARSRAP